jgi:hypothetical protein
MTSRCADGLYDADDGFLVGQRGRLAFETPADGLERLGPRRPELGRLLRTVTYALEHTPLRRLGLSHFHVVEKLPAPLSARRYERRFVVCSRLGRR